jgi:MFS family permease
MKKLFSSSILDVIRIRDFRFFLSFRFFLTMAALMQSVAVAWHLYSLTKNVLSLGLIGLVEVVPQISIALFAGHFVDIWDRKKIIQYATALLIIGAGILIIYSLPAVDGFHRFGTFPMFITIFITGLVRGILMPAHTALLGQLVPRDKLTSAATWSSTNWHVAAVLGPATGGMVYGFAGIVPAYIVVFLFYVSALLLILGIGPVERFSTPGNNAEPVVSRIKEGIRFVFRNEVLLGAFSLDMFAVLFGGAVAVLPVFASDILFIGPQGLGILRACPAIGAILMSAVLMAKPPIYKTGRFLFIGVAGFGICMIVFALSRNFYLSGVALLMSGAFDNISVVIRASILQLFTPDEMKGRVASVNSIFVGSSNELGAFESGLAAKIMGLVPSVIFGGVMTLLVVTVALQKSPRLRKLSLHLST